MVVVHLAFCEEAGGGSQDALASFTAEEAQLAYKKAGYGADLNS